MAACFGMLRGNKGQVTRCGSKRSGIQAILKTWQTRADCHLSAEDVLNISTEEKITIIVNGKKIKE